MNYLKVLFCVMLLSIWNNSKANEIPGVGIIDSNGNTALFYQVGPENIIGVKCRDFSNLSISKARKECIDSPRRILYATTISTDTFKDSLKKRLELSMYFDSKTLKIYNNKARNINKLESLEEKAIKLKNEITTRENFIDQFGESDKISFQITRLKNQLSSIEKQLPEITDLYSVIEDIDTTIECILNEVTGHTYVDYVYSDDSDTLAFNLLVTFFNYNDHALHYLNNPSTPFDSTNYPALSTF